MTIQGLEASPLRHVPLEVLLRIIASDFLTTPELCAFRLTCRAIHSFLDASFVAEFFTKKQFMLTIFSLYALVDISKSRLGPHLRYLHIGLDHIPISGHEFVTHGSQQSLEENRREIVFAERQAKALGYHRDLLVSAFKNLPNLEAIVLRDHNSKRRSRDLTEWKSYGFNTLRLKGLVVQTPNNGWGQDMNAMLMNVNDAFSLIMASCAQSGARPRTIEVMTRDNPLDDHIFAVPSFMRHETLRVIEGLQRLHLHFTPNSDSPELQTLLTSAPNLIDLRINQKISRHGESTQSAHRILEWLAAADKKTVLPKLRLLSLGRFSVLPDRLLGVIRAFPKLESLELWRINLYQIMNSDSLPRPKISFWPSFLKELRQTPDLSLRHIRFGGLSQNFRDPYGQSDHGQCPVVIPEGLDYTGVDWREYIEGRENNVQVRWNHSYEPITENSADDSVDEEVSEDEESSDDEDVNEDEDET